MQFKLFSIQIPGGEQQSEEMNAFIRSKKVLHIEQMVINHAQGCFWTFCIRYIDDIEIAEKDKIKIDYMKTLDAVTFKRFSELRKIRKRVAEEETVPAYVVFSDEELANMAKHEVLTAAIMKSIKGVGEKKMEKYAHHFYTPSPAHETSQPTD